MTIEHLTSKHSDSADPPPRRTGRPRRWRTVLRWGLGIVFVLLVIHVGLSFWSGMAVKRAAQRVADCGESLEFRDYLPPDVPDLENASHYLDAVAKLYHVFRHEQVGQTTNAVVPVDGQKGRERDLVAELARVLGRLDEEQVPPCDEDLALFRACVERFDVLYVILDKARPLTRARFRTHYSGILPMEFEVPHLVARINSARLLAARAILAVHEGRADDAYRDAAFLFRYANWVNQETPALIGKMIATGISQIGCQTTNQLMLVSPPERDAMKAITEEAGTLEPGTLFLRALHTERATTFSTLVDPDLTWRSLGVQFSDDSLISSVLLMTSFSFRPYVRLAAVAYSDGMTRVIQDSMPPAFERGPDLEKEEFVRRYCPGILSIPTRGNLEYYFRLSNRRDILLARLDLLALGFRLEDHRRESGAYPNRLDTLSGPQPVDPFSGEPYCFRTVDGGYVLYSVAGNRNDDGGHPAQKPWKNQQGDLVWRIR